MASDRQIEANRRNAEKCTGPRTEAGKQKSKMNALKHGLASRWAVLEHENRDEFEELKRTMLEEHAPVGITERVLTIQLAESYWRLLRARRVEASYLNVRFQIEGVGDCQLAGIIVQHDPAGLPRIERYVATAERAWQRTLRLLQQTQEIRRREQRHAERKARLETARPAQQPQPQPVETTPQQPSDREIGFVPADSTIPRVETPLLLPPQPAETHTELHQDAA